MFIKAACNGLCKICGLPRPSVHGVINFTNEVFNEIDENGNNLIDYEEFETWIKNSDSIQEFLLRYSGVQTFERAVKRKNEEYDKWLNMFDEVGVEFMDDVYVESYMLKI